MDLQLLKRKPCFLESMSAFLNEEYFFTTALYIQRNESSKFNQIHVLKHTLVALLNRQCLSEKTLLYTDTNRQKVYINKCNHTYIQDSPRTTDIHWKQSIRKGHFRRFSVIEKFVCKKDVIVNTVGQEYCKRDNKNQLPARKSAVFTVRKNM